MNRENDTSVTYWEQRNFKKSQPDPLRHRREWMAGIYSWSWTVSPLKGCCWTQKMPWFLASRGEKFNLGPVMKPDHSELLCNKVLLKYKRDRESFCYRHQKGAEKVATHSSTFAWQIPWKEEQSMGSLGVRHDWVTSLSLFPFMHWRRKWQPTPVFLPGESQGRGSLVGCHLWGRIESDTTEVT